MPERVNAVIERLEAEDKSFFKIQTELTVTKRFDAAIKRQKEIKSRDARQLSEYICSGKKLEQSNPKIILDWRQQ